ncbi:MAG: response regulator, partial [Actinomycetota bacterium]
MVEHLRVLIADDHPVVRRGLRAYLETVPGIEIVGEAGDGREAVRKALAMQPDVLLLDLLLPEMDGIGVIEELRNHQSQVAILVLTSFTGEEQVVRALRAGAVGYLLKDAEPESVADAIRAVAAGDQVLSPAAQAVVVSAATGRGAHYRLESLTSREREVLAGLGRGLTNRDLAGELSVSEKTIKTHVSSVLQKLGVARRTQAALLAVEWGL